MKDSYNLASQYGICSRTDDVSKTSEARDEPWQSWVYTPGSSKVRSFVFPAGQVPRLQLLSGEDTLSATASLLRKRVLVPTTLSTRQP